MIRAQDSDTICALATPVGHSAIAVIRLSGLQSVAVLRRIFPKLPVDLKTHQSHFGLLKDPSSNSETIDEVLVTVFLGKKSYTGEEAVEISCHGSPVIVDRILQALRASGARMAEPGEFTYRAFMNGKLDLVQAESVLSLIESQTQKAARQSLHQLQGHLSEKLEEIESEVIWGLAHLEASIDFSTEDLEIVSNDELDRRISQVLSQIEKFVDSYKAGRVLKNGFRIALMGEPNVGKSSLLNQLIGDQRAIVTDVPGTTRDVIEGIYHFEGLRFVALDTAGIRETTDQVEALGVARSRRASQESDAILLIFDLSRPLQDQDLSWTSEVDVKQVVFVGNKQDLTSLSRASVMKDLHQKYPQLSMAEIDKRLIFVSAKSDQGLQDLKKHLAGMALGQVSIDESTVLQARQHENLQKAQESLEGALVLVRRHAGAELIALTLKEALLKIQETIGKRFDDQILDRVFKEFCLGK